MRVYCVTIPMDAQGYFPTKKEAMRWLSKIRKANAALHYRKVIYQDGAQIDEVIINSAADLCRLINDNSRHYSEV